MVEGVDGLAGGLHPQAVCQIEGLDGIIKCGGAKVGSTGGVGQGARVDGGLRSIIVDISSEGSLLGIFMVSVSLLATTTSAASLSLGRSVSARTTVGPALLPCCCLWGCCCCCWANLGSAGLRFTALSLLA